MGIGGRAGRWLVRGLGCSSNRRPRPGASERGFCEPDCDQMETGYGVGLAAIGIVGARVEAAGGAAVGEEGSGATVEPGTRRLEGRSKWMQDEGGARDMVGSFQYRVDGEFGWE